MIPVPGKCIQRCICKPVEKTVQILRSEDIHVYGIAFFCLQRVEQVVDQTGLTHSPGREECRTPSVLKRFPQGIGLGRPVAEILRTLVCGNWKWILVHVTKGITLFVFYQKEHVNWDITHPEGPVAFPGYNYIPSMTFPGSCSGARSKYI